GAAVAVVFEDRSRRRTARSEYGDKEVVRGVAIAVRVLVACRRRDEPETGGDPDIVVRLLQAGLDGRRDLEAQPAGKRTGHAAVLRKRLHDGRAVLRPVL